MFNFKALLLAAPLALLAAPAIAQDGTAGRTSLYFGLGGAKSASEFRDDSTPLSIGIMHQLAGRKLVLGADIGREGTLLDSTWGRDQAVKQATSYNLLIGANVIENSRFRTDAALLVGVREDTSDCAASYLGYQCWANTEPDTEYKGNFGAVVNVSFNKMSLGVRATGESTQVIAGFRF
ncbi:hypothetical protein HOY34_08835 [Xinfangfangia sp. D13-10-4-6]|uniref:hypothetical protein n=1 Tax=Pseudogemmobacter hezensis TaxID=2737662 RepID=UPI001557A01C|nr:hypothetical protein [Pseudogemmobacter hezensis]NPD15302.1 hypothetical protein [Pseudogemmobacter hezensis]